MYSGSFSRRCSRNSPTLKPAARRPPHRPPAASHRPHPREPAPPPPEPRMLRQHALDLTQLDAETPHLHLMVDPTQELQRSVRQVTHQIPRAVQTRACLPAERDPARTSPLSAPHGSNTPEPARPRLMYNSPATPTGTGSHPRIQHIDPRVADRHARSGCSRSPAMPASIAVQQVNVVFSVGPYPLIKRQPGRPCQRLATCAQTTHPRPPDN